jgi:hypothetical protein
MQVLDARDPERAAVLNCANRPGPEDRVDILERNVEIRRSQATQEMEERHLQNHNHSRIIFGVAVVSASKCCDAVVFA